MRRVWSYARPIFHCPVQLIEEAFWKFEISRPGAPNKSAQRAFRQR